MPSGHYIQSIAGYRTFIPRPLPPSIELSSEMLIAIEDASHKLGQVEQCRRMLPNSDLLVYASLRNEAIASSTIEGTIASAEDLVMFQVDPESSTGATREVANYLKAMEWGYQQTPYRELTVNFIRSLHEILMDGVRGAEHAGHLKRRQNAIGSPNDTIESAAFVPCPPERVEDLMKQLETYLTGCNGEQRLVQVALVHHQFETIHPFTDGNGRVGRLLIALHLIKLGLLQAPLIYPSLYFERTRTEYYNRLQAVRASDDWVGWITYFAGAIKAASDRTLAMAEAILDLREQTRHQIVDVRHKGSVALVLDAFFHDPLRSVRQAAEHAAVAVPTAQAAITTMEGMGILREMTGRNYKRVYVCVPIMKAMFNNSTKTDGGAEVAAAENSSIE